MANIYQIGEILKEKGVSGKDFAVKIGITETSMSRIIQGKQQPKPELLLKIAKALDVDIRELFISTKNCLSDSDIERVVSNLKEAIRVLKPE